MLTKLVNEWDPIGLIEIGAPEDEYDCIVPQILTFLRKGMRYDDLLDFYMGDMSDHFGFSIMSVPEPYRSDIIKRTKESLIKICDWYENHSLENNDPAYSKFIIRKEINEIRRTLKSD